MTRIMLPGCTVAAVLLMTAIHPALAGEVGIEKLTITHEGIELESSRKDGAVIQYDQQHEHGVTPSSQQETLRATSKTPRPSKGPTIRIDGIEGESVDKDHKSHTLD